MTLPDTAATALHICNAWLAPAKARWPRERGAFVLTGRGGFELFASWESQTCFGNSFLEILTGPRTPAERLATTAAVRAVCDRLATGGVVSTFCLSPADDTELCAVYLGAGFRRSGVLARHIQIKGDRKDAIVWSRKLSVD